MVTVGLLVRIEAKPDKVAEVEALIKAAATRVEDEPGTITWFGLRLGPTTFGVFDAFADQAGREAHLAANAAALAAQAPDLFTGLPSIEHVDVLAAKLPGN
jgi:quinol monooxygenase YgiN